MFLFTKSEFGEKRKRKTQLTATGIEAGSIVLTKLHNRCPSFYKNKSIVQFVMHPFPQFSAYLKTMNIDSPPLYCCAALINVIRKASNCFDRRSARGMFVLPDLPMRYLIAEQHKNFALK